MMSIQKCFWASTSVTARWTWPILTPTWFGSTNWAKPGMAQRRPTTRAIADFMMILIAVPRMPREHGAAASILPPQNRSVKNPQRLHLSREGDAGGVFDWQMEARPIQ